MWWTIGSGIAGTAYLYVIISSVWALELHTRMIRNKHKRLLAGKLVWHATPSSARDCMGMHRQLTTMGMTQLSTGTLAGIGGALLVNNGHLAESPSWTALLLITGAMGALLSVGTFILLRQQRPLDDWVLDGVELRNWLIDIRRKGIQEGDLEQLRRVRQRFVTNTGIGIIKTVTDAAKCGIQDIRQTSGEHPEPTRQHLLAWNRKASRFSVYVLQPILLITAPMSAAFFLLGTPEASLVIGIVAAGATVAALGGFLILRSFLNRTGRTEWVFAMALFQHERAALREFDELYERTRAEYLQPTKVDVLTARVDTLIRRVESLLATAPRRRSRWSWRPSPLLGDHSCGMLPRSRSQ